MSVGSYIKSLREAKGWSKTELARRLTAAKNGKPTQRVSVIRWEAGKEHPNAENIKALEKVFGRPPTEFERFGVENTGRPSSPSKRFVQWLDWPDLKYMALGGAMHKQAVRKMRRLEVDESVPEHAFALTIQDESMSDRFQLGEEIIIDPSVQPVHSADDPDFVLVRLNTGQVVFRQYVLRAPGAYDLVGLHKDCKTWSVTPSEPAELLGTMIEHRRKRRRR